MLKRVGISNLAFAFGLAIGLVAGLTEQGVAQQSDAVVTAKFAPVSANEVLDRFGGASGTEVKLGHPQSHRIQFLKGGAARVHIWNGSRFMPGIFTAVESREDSRVCLARTRGWTGGCVSISSDGEDFRCRYLWNNGSSGVIGCRVKPIKAG